MLVSGVIGGTKWHEDEDTQLNKLLQNYGKLKKLVADLSLDNAILKEVLGKK